MSSSPEPAPDGATARLWRRRARGSHAIAYAAALIGDDIATLTDAVSISLAASEEASRLLDGMELRIRTLPTTVETHPERCIYSVRGPILWSETLTARSSAAGEDVFVCSTTARSFDTVENRILASALDAIARAGRALRGPTGDKVKGTEAERIAGIAAEAASWRAHPRLEGVKGGRLSSRDMARLRGGHRMSRMAPVLAVRARVAEPFVAEDLEGLADPWTRAYHRHVVTVLDALTRRVQLPADSSCSDGGIWSGVASWRHPNALGGTPAGLCYRGIPLLPPEHVIEGAPWAAAVPTDGVRVHGEQDVQRLLDRLSERRAGQTSSSRSSA